MSPSQPASLFTSILSAERQPASHAPPGRMRRPGRPHPRRHSGAPVGGFGGFDHPLLVIESEGVLRHPEDRAEQGLHLCRILAMDQYDDGAFAPLGV